MIDYKHAILLHKLYNNHQPHPDWIELNFAQILTSRQKHFKTIKNNNYIVGGNLLSTRLSVLNGKVLLDDLNLTLESYKVKYKQILIKSPITVHIEIKCNQMFLNHMHPCACTRTIEPKYFIPVLMNLMQFQ